MRVELLYETPSGVDHKFFDDFDEFLPGFSRVLVLNRYVNKFNKTLLISLRVRRTLIRIFSADHENFTELILMSQLPKQRRRAAEKIVRNVLSS